MKLFTKTQQVAFISYSLSYSYVNESLTQFPRGIVIKGDSGWQIWV